MIYNPAVSALAPHVFICFWYGRTLRERALAEQAHPAADQRTHLRSLHNRVRLYEALLLTSTAGTVRTETEFVQALQRVINGRSPTLRADTGGVIAQEARDLLRKWRDPRRDALYTYQ